MASDSQRDTLAELFTNRFEIIEEIEWGGLALMYRAQDEIRELVVAVAPIDCDDEDNAEAFRSLMSYVIALDSPTLLEIAEHDVLHGVPYLAYRHRDDPVLFQKIEDDGPMSPAEAYALGRDLLDPMIRAHESALWHGDLTPRNVLIGNAGPKVLGLGLWTLLQERTSERREGMPFSDLFRAPEVRDGKGEFASDQYSIAMIVAYALTGEEPGAELPEFDELPGMRAWIERASHPAPRQRFDDLADARAAYEKVHVGRLEPTRQARREVVSEKPPAPEKSEERSSWPLALLVLAAIGVAWFFWPRGGADGRVRETEAETVSSEEPESLAEEAAEEAAGAAAEEAVEPAPAPVAAIPAVVPTPVPTPVAGAIAGRVIDGSFIPNEEVDVSPALLADRSRGPLLEPLPPLLETTMERIARGEEFSQRADVRPLIRFARANRRDVRAHLVLARAFMHLGWYKSALERYRTAVHTDAEATASDPRALSDLVRVTKSVDDEDDFLDGFRALRRGWGRAALPYVQTVYQTTTGWKKRRAMAKLIERMQAL